MCGEGEGDCVGVQRASFRRYGVWGDWSDPYLTLHPKFEAAQIQATPPPMLAQVLPSPFPGGYRPAQPPHSLEAADAPNVDLSFDHWSVV